MRIKKLALILFIAVQIFIAKADGISGIGDTLTKAPDNWFNLDAQKDGVRGVSAERTYKELFKNKKSTKIIVAVLDSGIDIEHEDLKSKIWTNPKEIAGNGIDDDKNGYIDDMHGWNFIGGKDGTQVDMDTWEATRLYGYYTKKFEGKNENSLSRKEKKEYKKYLEVKKYYEKEREQAENIYNQIKSFQEMYLESEKLLKRYLDSDIFTEQQLKVSESDNDSIQKAKKLLTYAISSGYTKEAINEGLNTFEERLNYKLNPDFDSRHIVGDNYSDKKEKYYGNNLVKGPDSFHGTHVAGIIGADRNNNIGIKGIAENIEFMVLRMVPSGDERDKDVANAIYYAVDNGAKIINMSFGKRFSPDKKYVDKAFKYAAKHNVLIVHAAGNEADNNDEIIHYPYRKYLKSRKECKTWVEVGASSWGGNDNFVGSFSNYGKKNVDLFAPGVDIYSTAPEQKYQNASGTSMAAPVVSGVAALIWSYYPELKAKQMKKILLQSVVFYGEEKINFPGEKNKTIKFNELCNTGGIVNAYKAAQLAEKMTK